MSKRYFWPVFIFIVITLIWLGWHFILVNRDWCSDFTDKDYKKYTELVPEHIDRKHYESACFTFIGLHSLSTETDEEYQDKNVKPKTNVAAIRSFEEYQQDIIETTIMLGKRKLNCSNYTYPEINFSQKTFLAIVVEGLSTIDTVRTRLYRDDDNKRVIALVDVKDCCEGACALSAKLGYEVILSPKIPDDYSVEFHVRHSSNKYTERTIFGAG